MRWVQAAGDPPVIALLLSKDGPAPGPPPGSPPVLLGQMPLPFR